MMLLILILILKNLMKFKVKEYPEKLHKNTQIKINMDKLKIHNIQTCLKIRIYQYFLVRFKKLNKI